MELRQIVVRPNQTAATFCLASNKILQTPPSSSI